jgi:Fur family zinc uptake transcriptional regulator
MALTPARREIFDILAQARKPLGAYEIIEALAARTGKRPAPMSVYRALDFLLEQGLAHRLASRNAWLACGAGRHGDEPVAFLICACCGAVAEATSEPLRDELTALARAAGFRPHGQVVELSGLCAECDDA